MRLPCPIPLLKPPVSHALFSSWQRACSCLHRGSSDQQRARPASATSIVGIAWEGLTSHSYRTPDACNDGAATEQRQRSYPGHAARHRPDCSFAFRLLQIVRTRDSREPFSPWVKCERELSARPARRRRRPAGRNRGLLGRPRPIRRGLRSQAVARCRQTSVQSHGLTPRCTGIFATIARPAFCRDTTV